MDKMSPLVLSTDRSGTSTVELALIMPLLALLTFVAADVAMAFKAKIRLQAAAERTAQMATRGGLNSTAYQNLAADAAQGAGVPTNGVTVTETLLCNGTAQSSTVGTCSTGQQIQRYVAIGITSNYMPMFGKFLPGSRLSATQGITLTGSSSVRLQ